MKKILCTLTFVLFTAGIVFSSPAFAQSVVVPNAFTNQAGDALNDAFDCQRPNGLRAQTVYLGSEIGAGTITSFAVRGLPGSPAFGPQNFPNAIFKLSTTDKSPGGLSSVFSENVGPDEVTVFQGSFPTLAPDCTGLSPCPFAQPIVFQNSFFFDPSQGNLLLEVIIPFCAPQFALPDSDAAQDPAGNVTQLVFADADDALDGQLVSGGTIIEFNLVGGLDVPALSEWGLIAMAGVLGLLGFIGIRRMKQTA